MDAWLEDFRADIAQIKIPTLVIHGDSDQILPIEATGKRTASLIPGAQFYIVKDGPHGLNWTHAAEVNKVLLEFLGPLIFTQQTKRPGIKPGLLSAHRPHYPRAAVIPVRISSPINHHPTATIAACPLLFFEMIASPMTVNASVHSPKMSKKLSAVLSQCAELVM